MNCNLYWCISEFYEEKDDIKHLYINQCLQEFLHSCGIDRSTLIGHFRRQYFSQEHQFDVWIDQFKEIYYLRSSNISQIEYQWTSPNGKTYIFLHTICYIGISSNNSRPQFFTSLEDITNSSKLGKEVEGKHTEVEKAIKISSCYQIFYEHSPILMGTAEVIEDSNDIRILHCNPISCQLFLRPLERLIGSRLGELGIPQIIINEWIYQFKKSRQIGDAVEFEIENPICHLTPDYSFRNISVCIISLRKNAFSYFAVDITKRVDLETELRRNKELLEEIVKSRTNELQMAMKTKSRFLATMSHEMRTPLNGILGSLSVLSSSEMIDKQHETVSISQICGEYLLILVNDIFDFSKLDENTFILDFQPFLLTEAIEKAMEIVSLESAKQSVELSSDIDLPLLTTMIVGDSVRLRQILVNLLGNALKFSSKGDVVLSASLLPHTKNSFSNSIETILFAICDQGIGIPKEAKKELHERFTLLEGPIKRRFSGTGVGLNISKRLVDLMHGSMWFESEESKGSTFYFTISVPLFRLYSLRPLQRTTKIRVLIVSPYVGFLRTFAQLLQNLGLHSETCESIEEVLERLKPLEKSQDATQNIRILFTNPTPKEEQFEKLMPLFGERSLVVIDFKRSPSLCSQIHYLKKPVSLCALQTLLNKVIINTLKIIDCNQEHLTEERPLRSTRIMPNPILIAEDNVLNQRVIR